MARKNIMASIISIWQLVTEWGLKILYKQSQINASKSEVWTGFPGMVWWLEDQLLVTPWQSYFSKKCLLGVNSGFPGSCCTTGLKAIFMNYFSCHHSEQEHEPRGLWQPWPGWLHLASWDRVEMSAQLYQHELTTSQESGKTLNQPTME